MARVTSLYANFPVEVDATEDNGMASVVNHYFGPLSAGDDPDLLGESYDSPFGGVNIDTGGLTNYFNNYQNYNPEQQGYELDQYLNTAEAGNVKTVLVNHVTGFLPDGVTAFENNLADTIAHEDGHNIGLAHPWDYLSPNVGSVSVTNGGSGYTSVPTVTFTAGRGGGAGLTGTAVVTGGVVTGINVTNPGSGYVFPPTVTISGGGGSGTTATASLPNNQNNLNIMGYGRTIMASSSSLRRTPHRSLGSKLLATGRRTMSQRQIPSCSRTSIPPV